MHEQHVGRAYRAELDLDLCRVEEYDVAVARGPEGERLPVDDALAEEVVAMRWSQRLGQLVPARVEDRRQRDRREMRRRRRTHRGSTASAPAGSNQPWGDFGEEVRSTGTGRSLYAHSTALAMTLRISGWW